MTTRTPFSPITTVDWRDTTVLGTPYIDVRYDTKHNGTNITSILTGAIGFNMVKTYSDGRMTADWFNHLDRNYQIFNYDAMFTPFLNFEPAPGRSTGRSCPGLMKWPALMKPWAILEMVKSAGHLPSRKFYRLEGSAYGLSPVGPQKVYSRIVSPD